MKISIKAINDAYEKSGLRPARWSTFKPPEGCGCALQAVRKAHGYDDARDLSEVALKHFGVPDIFTRGFLLGFDGLSAANIGTDLGIEGFSNGRTVAAAIFGEPL